MEAAVAELAEMLTQLGTEYKPSVVTSWQPGQIPGTAQMTRYLGNVFRICQLAGVTAALPVSMGNLNWEKANQIELALLAVYKKITQEEKPCLLTSLDGFVLSDSAGLYLISKESI